MIRIKNKPFHFILVLTLACVNIHFQSAKAGQKETATNPSLTAHAVKDRLKILKERMEETCSKEGTRCWPTADYSFYLSFSFVGDRVSIQKCQQEFDKETQCTVPSQFHGKDFYVSQEKVDHIRSSCKVWIDTIMGYEEKMEKCQRAGEALGMFETPLDDGLSVGLGAGIGAATGGISSLFLGARALTGLGVSGLGKVLAWIGALSLGATGLGLVGLFFFVLVMGVSTMDWSKSDRGTWWVIGSIGTGVLGLVAGILALKSFPIWAIIGLLISVGALIGATAAMVDDHISSYEPFQNEGEMNRTIEILTFFLKPFEKEVPLP